VRRYFMHVGMTFADLHITALLVAVIPSYVVAAELRHADPRTTGTEAPKCQGEHLAPLVATVVFPWRWLTSLRPGPRSIEGYEAAATRSHVILNSLSRTV
jgi:hypothetical protein